MTRKCLSINRGGYSGCVRFNKKIGRRFYRLRLIFEGAGASAFAKAEAGQFAELDLSDVQLPPAEDIPQNLIDAAQRKILLRRPFSFCDVIAKKGETLVDILYCVLGPGTLRMSTLSAGDSISVIGPLGKGFRVQGDKKMVLLVSGGMGVGPLLHLAGVLTDDFPTIEVTAFAGVSTAKELPFERRLDEISQQIGFSVPEFARYGVESSLATDDGSAGYEGFVTDCFSQWLGQHNPAAEDVIIYSCGPEAMLARVAQIAQQRNIDCQVSTERLMACGIGLCQGCAVECKVDGSEKTVYKMCCKDGPVFDSREVVWGS